MSDEEKKDRQNYAIVTFNLAFMACMGLLYYALGLGVWLSLGIAFPLAAVAAGVLWKVKSR